MNPNYPKGANALLIALSTPNPRGSIGLPVILWGKPGVGKSSFIDSLATDHVKVLTLIASIHDPTDFSGLPIFEDGAVRYAVPEWVKEFEDYDTGILFLDELSTAPPSVQAALLRVVLERKVGFHELPNSVRIVAAANPPDLMVGGWELSPPLRNRFVHLDWEISPKQFINSLSSDWEAGQLIAIDTKEHAQVLPEWKVKIAAFLNLSKDSLHSSSEDSPYAFASPRTWDYTAHLLASCDLLGLAPKNENPGSSVCNQLIRGCLGEGITIALLEFLKNIKLPNPEEILRGQKKLDIPKLNDSELYIIFASMNRVLLDLMEDASVMDATFSYFNYARKVFADGRRDLIYVSLKQLARAGLLIKLISHAQGESPEKLKQVMNAIEELFSDAGLKEFIDVFEK